MPAPRLSFFFSLIAYAAINVGFMKFFHFPKDASNTEIVLVTMVVGAASCGLLYVGVRSSVVARGNGR